MTGKRTRSFKCAVHHRDREVCSENDFHILVQEPPVFRRWVNKWLSDRRSCLWFFRRSVAAVRVSSASRTEADQQNKIRHAGVSRHVRRRSVSLVTSWCSSNLPWAGVQFFFFLWGRLKNYEKRLWPSPVCLSVCSHRIDRLPLDGFPQNLIFESFRKSGEGRELSILKILQEYRALHLKTCVHVWSYLLNYS